MSSGPQLSVATICFDGFGDEDFAPTFSLASEVGIRNLEINAWYPRNLTPDGVRSIRERCQHAGLVPATLQVSAFAPGPEPADLTRETARWMWLFDAARELGVEVVKATGSGRGRRGGLAALIDLLRILGPVAERAGLTIALENHLDNVLETPQDYREIFAGVGSPAVGMCLDTGHLVASGLDPVAVAADLAEHVVHIDLKDCTGPGPDRFVRFGEGLVDFDGVLAEAITPDFTGYVVVELPLVDERTVIADIRAGAAVAASAISGIAPHHRIEE